MTVPASRTRTFLTPLGKAVLAVVVVVVVTFVGLLVVGARVNSKSHTIGGDFTLRDPQAAWTMDGACTGAGGYGDVTAGAPVTVRDGSGKVLGTGQLGAGVADDEHTCVFPISVPDVPQTGFYAVSVGGRGESTISKADMEADAWQVEFTLGS